MGWRRRSRPLALRPALQAWRARRRRRASLGADGRPRRATLLHDVVVLRAPKAWSLSDETKIIVPVGGRGGHDALRARLLGSLGRAGLTNVRFVQVTDQPLTDSAKAQRERELRIFAEEETYGTPQTKIIESDDTLKALVNEAGPHDLIILGLQHERSKRLFSKLALQVARETESATLMISRRT